MTSLGENRVAHTQLFLGPEGSGSFALALAFIQFINCSNQQGDDSCGSCPSCQKIKKFGHPDLHFYFPTTTNESVKKDPWSELFLNDWRSYLDVVTGYPSQKGWHQKMNSGNKQGTIYVRDASNIIQNVAVKPYESKYKAYFIWMAERMHESASNKLLKTFEEPPANTLIFLFAERYELLLPTVRSRAQLVKVDRLGEDEIKKALIEKKGLGDEMAAEIALLAEGNWNLAIEILENREETEENFVRFRDWMRLCFRPGNFLELNHFNTEIAKTGRESIKRFLSYGLDLIHNCMLYNSGNNGKIKKTEQEIDFLQKFAPFINAVNQAEIYGLLNESIYHIERNAHAGILFSDLSLKMGEQLQKGKSK